MSSFIDPLFSLSLSQSQYRPSPELHWLSPASFSSPSSLVCR
jgi:hypothetical protein